MRRIYKVIGGMLAAGALIAGIGSGLAFAEYCSFEYGGEKVLEGSERFIKTLEYQMTDKETLNVIVYNPYTVIEDTKAAKDEVRFVIHYLSDRKEVQPEVIEEEMDFSGEETEDTGRLIYLDCDYQYSALRDAMRIKDPVLKDIKAHKLSDYQLDEVEMIEIYVNPEADFKLNVNQ